MAVTECVEQNLEGKRSFEVTLAEGTTCKRTFRITTDSDTDTETDIFFGAQSVGPHPLPSPLSFFPGSGMARSYHYTISRDQQSSRIGAWVAMVDYKTIFNQEELDRQVAVNPCDRPARISGGSRTVMVPQRECLRTGFYNEWPPVYGGFEMGVAANSAGDPLDPPIEVASSEWEIHCEKDVPYLPEWFFTYENGINSADQTIYINGVPRTIKAGCGKLSAFNYSTRKQESNYDFITISWNVSIRRPRPKFGGETSVPSPWDVERLDEGTRYRSAIGDQTVWHNVYDSTRSVTVTTPVPFNGAGREVTASGDAILPIYIYKACYRTFPVVDYSILPWD